MIVETGAQMSKFQTPSVAFTRQLIFRQLGFVDK